MKRFKAICVIALLISIPIYMSIVVSSSTVDNTDKKTANQKITIDRQSNKIYQIGIIPNTSIKIGDILNKKLELIQEEQDRQNKRDRIQSAINNQKIMFIGNSLVEGLRQCSNSKNTFYCKVGISLNGLKEKIYNQISNTDYDVVVIEMGTNELGSYSEEQFKESYIDLIEHIRKKNNDTIIVALSIPPVSALKSSSGRFSNQNVGKYTNYIIDVSNSTNIYYVDCSDYFGKVLNSSWTGDGIHLKASRYTEWYNFIIDRLYNLI